MNVLVVFVKSPRPGAVKTRLIPALGAVAAAELYRALAEEEIRRTAPRGGEYQRLFLFAPAEAGPGMEAWLPGEEWIPQEGGDLGARMTAAFDEAFARGFRRAAIIGSDVPWVSREQVLDALRSLDDHDVAIGPTHDGGYYLIALDRPRPGLFQGIAWSTPAVFAATVERASVLGLTVRVLEPLRDIDTFEDVRSEWGRLDSLLEGRTALREAVRAALAREVD